MQEGILSLMQMPRTTIAVQRLREARLPYIVVLTDPTTGGVTASYAMLGDVHIAEPGALICFAGPRVIQQTIREQLPEGFQRAEYLLAHGMIDMVVHRHKMRETLASVVGMLMSGARHAETEERAVAGRKPAGEPAGATSGEPAAPVAKAHVNGTSSAERMLPKAGKTDVRTGGKDVVEAEPVDDDERFDTSKLEPRPKGRRGEDAGKDKASLPKDPSRT